MPGKPYATPVFHDIPSVQTVVNIIKTVQDKPLFAVFRNYN